VGKRADVLGAEAASAFDAERQLNLAQLFKAGDRCRAKIMSRSDT